MTAYNNFDSHSFQAKVYTILAAQLVATSAITSVVTWNDSIRYLVLSNVSSIAISCFILGMVSLAGCHITRTDKNQNWFWLGLFTVAMSVSTSTTCAIYYEHGYGLLIFKSILMTTILFVLLSLLGRNQRASQFVASYSVVLNFSLWILIAWGLFSVITRSHLDWVYCLIGSIVFCLHVIYDTQKLSMRYAATNDYVLAAIELYLDVVNLFLYILRLLRELEDTKEKVKSNKRSE